MAYLLSNKVFASNWLFDNPVATYFQTLTTPEIIIGVMLFLFTFMVKFYVLKWHEGCEDPNTKKKGWSFSGIFAGLVCTIGVTVTVIMTLHQHNWDIKQPAANIANTMGTFASQAANVANKAAIAGYRSAANVAANVTGPPPYYRGL